MERNSEQKNAPGAPEQPLELLSDDVRRRESRRRREDAAWSVVSFVLHVVLALLLLFCTPVRKLVLPPEKEPVAANPAADLAADRVEQISRRLSQARTQELLRQIELLQTILHNMDLVKDELQKDYDSFAGQSAESARTRIEEMIAEVDRSQGTGIERQDVALRTADRIAAQERYNLRDKATADNLRADADRLWHEEGARVNEALANAQNGLDRVDTEARFAGFQRTAEAATLLREAQIKIARNQATAQQAVYEKARKVSGLPEAVTRQERLEKSHREQTDRKHKAEATLREVQAAIPQFERDREHAAGEKADRERQMQERTHEAASLVSDIRNEERALQQARREKRTEEIATVEGRINEFRRREKEARTRADQLRSERDQANRRMEQATRRIRDAQNRERDSKRTLEDANRRLATIERDLSAARTSVANLEKLIRENDPAAGTRQLGEIRQSQIQLRERLSVLRDTLAADEPAPTRLHQENRAENALVLKDAGTLSLEDAYALALSLEQAVTESFQNVKATQMGIESRIAFDAALKLTDVVKPVRDAFPAVLREATPRTKDALDRRKEAEAGLLREADSMVDTSAGMLTEALEMVGLRSDAPHTSVHARRQISWLRPEDFAARSTQEAREQRFERMFAVSNLVAQMFEAAAEDEQNRAKDMAEVMAAADAVEASGDAVAAASAESLPEEGKGQGLGPESSFRHAAANPPALHGTGDDLLPGNVLRTRTDAGDGVPAQWMYLNSWYVIGPFPNPDRINLRRKFAPESVVDLDATYIGKDGRTIRWEFEQARSLTRPGGKAGRAVIIPRSAEEYGIWYAYTELFVDEACDLWIAVGSDDRSDLWVNGMKVWASGNELKVWNIAEGFRKVHFRKGRNQLLARIENGWYALGWSVCVSTGPEMTAL